MYHTQKKENLALKRSEVSSFMRLFEHRANEMFDACECFVEVGDGVCVRTAYVALTAVTEGITRDDGDFFCAEQLFCEFHRGESRSLDGREDVEGTFRLEAVETHRAESFDHQSAAAVLFFDHLLHLFFREALFPQVGKCKDYHYSS